MEAGRGAEEKAGVIVGAEAGADAGAAAGLDFAAGWKRPENNWLMPPIGAAGGRRAGAGVGGRAGTAPGETAGAGGDLPKFCSSSAAAAWAAAPERARVAVEAGLSATAPLAGRGAGESPKMGWLGAGETAASILRQVDRASK